MTQSAEYSDLRWMPPRAYGRGRDGKAVRYIVIHYTAGAERSTSAEDGAVYDGRRTDGTSTHYFVDSDSVVQCVRTTDRANAARNKGNRLGIQYELCGTAQTRAQWLDAASLPTLRNAARQVARDCRRYGIPVRRLSVVETRRAWTEFPDGPRGIVGHVDCTNAYPEDGGDHTDPGTGFPWDLFLDMVRAEMEDDVALSEADKKWLTAANQQAAQRVEEAIGHAAARVEKAVSDAVAGLVEVSALKGPDGQPDGTTSTPVGHYVLSQGVPNPTKPGAPRDPAWQVLADIGGAVGALPALIAEAIKNAPPATKLQ